MTPEVEEHIVTNGGHHPFYESKAALDAFVDFVRRGRSSP